MVTDSAELLRQATALAVLMVDQIEYVDLLEDELSELHERPVREDGRFRQDATAYVRDVGRRDALKRIVERLAGRIAAQPLAMRLLNPHDVCLAAELVTKAVKGLLASQGDNAWLRPRRLVIQFTTIGPPWIQDAVGRAHEEAARGETGDKTFGDVLDTIQLLAAGAEATAIADRTAEKPRDNAASGADMPAETSGEAVRNLDAAGTREQQEREEARKDIFVLRVDDNGIYDLITRQLVA